METPNLANIPPKGTESEIEPPDFEVVHQTEETFPGVSEGKDLPKHELMSSSKPDDNSTELNEALDTALPIDRKVHEEPFQLGDISTYGSARDSTFNSELDSSYTSGLDTTYKSEVEPLDDFSTPAALSYFGTSEDEMGDKVSPAMNVGFGPAGDIKKQLFLDDDVVGGHISSSDDFDLEPEDVQHPSLMDVASQESVPEHQLTSVSKDLPPSEPAPPVAEPEPVAKPEPVPIAPKPAELEPKPEVIEPKPAPVEPKLAPVEPEPAPVEPEPEPVEPKPAPFEAKPAPVEMKKTEEVKPSAAQESAEELLEMCETMELFCKMGLDAWFNPERLHPIVGDLVYWRDPKKSGIVLGSGLGVLLSLSFFSLISVIAYLSLLLLTGTICYRIYKNVLQAVQKTSDGHPFKDILELDLTLPQDKVREVTDIAIAHVNASIVELRRLFLVEDLVDSIKFGVLLWCLTYLGAWFNGMTLIIIAFVAMFTLPKVYENNKSQIDQNLDIVRAKLADISAKVKAAVPIGKKPPAAEEKKEQ